MQDAKFLSRMQHNRAQQPTAHQPHTLGQAAGNATAPFTLCTHPPATFGAPCCHDSRQALHTEFAKRSHMLPTNTRVHTDTHTELKVTVEPWPQPPPLLLLPHVPLPADLMHWDWA